jgi:predicted  nucleic acid-binding Zn-ribbon protein
MLEVLSKFINLEKLDRLIRDSQNTLDAGPAKLKVAEDKLKVIENDAQNLQTEIAANLAQQQEMETELKKYTKLKEGNRERITKANDAKSYTAILKEGENIAKLTDAKEKEVLTLMVAMDSLNAKLPLLTKELKEAQKVFNLEKDAINAELAEATRVISKSTEQRSSILSLLDPKYAAVYTKAAATFGGKTLAPIADSTCMACRMAIPRQQYNELLRNDKLMTCPACQRIMYWQHDPTWAPPKPAPEEPETLAAPKKKQAKKTKSFQSADTNGNLADLKS